MLDLPQISRLLTEQGVSYKTHFTEHKYHAVELTVKAVNEGYRKVIIVGGDGTIHEVVNGLFIQDKVAPAEVTLGLIRTGMGLDWAHAFGYQHGDYQGAIAAIVRGESRLQDVGEVSYEESRFPQKRYMVGVGGTGFDAFVTKAFTRKIMALREGRITSMWSYIWILFKSYFRHRNQGVRVYLDDELIYDRNCFSIAFGITKFNGGGFQQLPKAVADDGLFDMTIFRPLHFWHLLFRAKYLFNGELYRIGHIEHHQGGKIRIEGKSYMDCEIDGELLGGTPLTLTLLPHALRIIKLD